MKTILNFLVQFFNAFIKLFKKPSCTPHPLPVDKIEVGCTYRQHGDKCLYFVTSISPKGVYSAFGLDWRGIWKSECEFGSIENNTHPYKVDHSEIEKEVRKIASEIRYTVHNVTSLNDSKCERFYPKECDWHYSIFNSIQCRLFSAPKACGGYILFDNGKFANKK